MRNTLIPLDMIFINSEPAAWRASSRGPSRARCTSRSRGRAQPVRAGGARRLDEKVGIRKGSTVRFEGVAGLDIAR